jgi:S-adenosyl-L-methionine hydrolase (adenosine-forming)
MPIITLTTDFGYKDHYLALIKGAMLCQFPSLNIVDITHEIKNYDIVQAAFIFRNAWAGFPAGTIHVLSVDDFHDGRNEFIAIRHAGHYFIGPDNGVFSLVFDDVPKEIYTLEYSDHDDFPLKDVYARAVGHIAKELPFHEIGFPAGKIVRRLSFQPVISHSHIRGSVIHIDNYDNVIVNIRRELFEQVANGRAFALYFKRHDPITRLSSHYHDVPVGEPLCLFNSAGYVEIAVNMGKAATLLGLKLEDTVQVDFKSMIE